MRVTSHRRFAFGNATGASRWARRVAFTATLCHRQTAGNFICIPASYFSASHMARLRSARPPPLQSATCAMVRYWLIGVYRNGTAVSDNQTAMLPSRLGWDQRRAQPCWRHRRLPPRNLTLLRTRPLQMRQECRTGVTSCWACERCTHVVDVQIAGLAARAGTCCKQGDLRCRRCRQPPSRCIYPALL